jgi:DNA-binding MarR family transcriptional regulator
MPRQSPPIAEDQTPHARLSEGATHAILGYQLAQASVTTTRVFEQHVGRPFGLRPVEYTILALVHDNRDATARQLAKALSMTPPNIALWLEKMESRGLVTRKRSARDARLQHIRTTASGAALAVKATRRLLDAEREALVALSAAEQAMLVELLHKIALARKRQAGVA